MIEELKKLVAVAKGDVPADIVLRGGIVVDVLSGELVRDDVAIVANKIAGIGKYEGEVVVDISGKYVLPGLLDSHAHIEPSRLSPQEYAREIIKHGTTGLIVNPHQISRECGLAGVEFMMHELAKTPLNCAVMLPCELTAEEIEKNISRKEIFGLSVFSNYEEILSKIKLAHNVGKAVDGHITGVGGLDLNAFFASGIRTNHECASVKEIQSTIKRGGYVHLGYGTKKNMPGLLSGVTQKNLRRFTFCTLEKSATEIMENGHINESLRIAVAMGIDPVDAVTMATLNTAECYRMKRRGAIAPSYYADITVVDNLKNFKVREVFINGKHVATDGKCHYNKSTIDFKRVVVEGITDGELELPIAGLMSDLKASDVVAKLNQPCEQEVVDADTEI